MSNYFGRFWKLRIKDRLGNFDYTIKKDDYGRSLRVKFDIKATTDLKYYSGTIKIYNLAPGKRKNLIFNLLLDKFGTGPSVQLTAGYDQKNGIIFDGAVTRGFTIREGVDWVTTLYVGIPLKNDKEITIQSEAVNNGNLFSFLFDAVAKIVDQPDRVEIKRAPNYKKNFQAAVDEFLNVGNIKNKQLGWNGYATSILSEISTEFNILFFIDHQGLNAISGKFEQSSSGQSPLTIPDDTTVPEKIFTKENGLIGSPIYTDTGAKIITYLMPELRIFQYIGARSDVLNKNFSIHELIHRGDTHDNDWFSEIDGSNINQLLRYDT